jgi:hypothetical protein
MTVIPGSKSSCHERRTSLPRQRPRWQDAEAAALRRPSKCSESEDGPEQSGRLPNVLNLLQSVADCTHAILRLAEQHVAARRGTSWIAWAAVARDRTPEG